VLERGARTANEVAEVALRAACEARPDAPTLLGYYQKINAQVDDLVNRWLGRDKRTESRALMHSLNYLFDWSDVLLIAMDIRSEVEGLHDALDKIRRFLLFKVLRRRLGYTDDVVPLEALRVINRAMWLALHKERTIDFLCGQPTSLRPLSAGQEGAGLFDLMLMVGQLKQHHSMDGPVGTEVSVFFALTVLLVPSSPYLIGHVISESGLSKLTTAITHQMKLIDEALGLGRDRERLRRALSRFSGGLPEERGWEESYSETVAEELAKAELLAEAKALAAELAEALEESTKGKELAKAEEPAEALEKLAKGLS